MLPTFIQNTSPKRLLSSTARCFTLKERIRKEGPSPWLKRKGVVFVVCALVFWSYYVFVGRVAVRMIRSDSDSLGTRSEGIAYLVVFNVLFCMISWSYVRVITTAPGYARDYVPQSDVPLQTSPRPRIEYAGPPYSAMTPIPSARVPHSSDSSEKTNVNSQNEKNIDAEVGDAMEMKERETLEEGPEVETFATPAGTVEGEEDEDDTTTVVLPPPPHISGPISLSAHASSSSVASTSAPSTSIPPVVRISPPAPVHFSTPSPRPSPPSPFPSSPSPTSSPPTPGPAIPTPTFPSVSPQTHKKSLSTSTTGPRSFMNFPPPPEGYSPTTVRQVLERSPPDSRAVLTEFYRYDYELGLVRPHRSHRCRECGSVVLKMDHHCPWIGQCVGARNYKYFYNFLIWCTAYAVFTFLALIICNARPHSPRPKVDGEQIALLVLCFIFGLFTGALLVVHTVMTLQNCTTIEHYAFQTTKDKDNRILGEHFGFWDFKAKRRVKKEWVQEWGRLKAEGNLWWKGSRRANWVMVMGEQPLRWFLPLQARPVHDDGLSYVPNPRFSPEGVWRPRREWPEELR